jgi:hypothetical protein
MMHPEPNCLHKEKAQEWGTKYEQSWSRRNDVMINASALMKKTPQIPGPEALGAA